MLDKITNIFAAKPYLGMSAAGGGGLAGLLTWLNYISPVIGFLAALFGMLAGLFTLLIKIREWNKGR
jgi:hypothetical protein